MKNGDKWVTIRDSFEEMNTVIECIVKDKEVLKFTVEEKLNDHEEKDDLNRQITNLRIKQKELEKENKRLYQACHLAEVIKLRKENVRLVAQ